MFVPDGSVVGGMRKRQKAAIFCALCGTESGAEMIFSSHAGSVGVEAGRGPVWGGTGQTAARIRTGSVEAARGVLWGRWERQFVPLGVGVEKQCC